MMEETKTLPESGLLDPGEHIDWNGCPEVEHMPGKVSGVPILKHSRVQADGIMLNAWSGYSAEDVAAMFILPVKQVRAVIEWGLAHFNGCAKEIPDGVILEDPSGIDWTGCCEAERVAGVAGGLPVLKGTKVQANHVWSAARDGYSIETIAELFDASVAQVRAVVEYGRNRQ